MKRKHKFKIGDKVTIRHKGWYAYRKRFYVEYIFKDGSMRLRSAKDESIIIERYEPEDLRMVK